MFHQMLAITTALSVFSAYDSAKILGVFPMPFRSHHIVYKKYVQNLANRGHELVIITPMPIYRNEKTTANIIEIDTEFPFGKLATILNIAYKRGIACDMDVKLDYFKNKNIPFIRQLMESMNHPKINKLIEEKTHFDLIVTEFFIDSALIFSHFFNAPAIQISPLCPPAENFETIGALSRHPEYYPNAYRNNVKNISFIEKVNEMTVEYKLMKYIYNTLDYQNEVLIEFYGGKSPTVQELKKNVMHVFGNCRHIFDNNRPTPMNMVYLGGLHLDPVKKLPQNIKAYLDNSTRGVVYVSFGTNVNLSSFSTDLLQVFLDAFKVLPFDILLKSDINDLNVTDNVKMDSWFPQRDLLMHPNIKAFIMQGGLQSTDEAIDAGVPVIGMPTWGDQDYNVNKYLDFGIGLKLDAITVTAHDVVEAVMNVVNDKSFRENIQRLRSQFEDQPQSSIERAIWWTEFAVRHGIEPHLRSPAALIGWTKYYVTDILALMALSIAAVIVCVVYIMCLVKRKLS